MYNFNNKIGSEFGHDSGQLTYNLKDNKTKFKFWYQKYRDQKQINHLIDRTVGTVTPTIALTKFNGGKSRFNSQFRSIKKDKSSSDIFPDLAPKL